MSNNITFQTNVKLITSGNVPSTANLLPGELAFGLVSDDYYLYGNPGGTGEGSIVQFMSGIPNVWSLARGGTGVTTAAGIRDLIGLGNTTDTRLGFSHMPTSDTVGHVLRISTANGNPAFAALPIADTTGTLVLARGGTGATIRTGVSGVVNNIFPESIASEPANTLHVMGVTTNWVRTGHISIQLLRERMGLGNTLAALPLANGGTGGTTALAARTNLALLPTSNTLFPTALTTAGWFLALPTTGFAGGAGHIPMAAARNSMGLGNTTGPLPVVNGGTGSVNAQISGNLGGINLGGRAGQIECLATGGFAASISFHRSGVFAFNLGLGTAFNDLAVGGWSKGNVQHRVYHQGNAPIELISRTTQGFRSGSRVFTGDQGLNSVHIGVGGTSAARAGEFLELYSIGGGNYNGSSVGVMLGSNISFDAHSPGVVIGSGLRVTHPSVIAINTAGFGFLGTVPHPNSFYLGLGHTPRASHALAVSSDSRDKFNVTDLKFDALELIKKLKPAQYQLDFRFNYVKLVEIDEEQFDQLLPYDQIHNVDTVNVLGYPEDNIEYLDQQYFHPDNTQIPERNCTEYICKYYNNRDECIDEYMNLHKTCRLSPNHSEMLMTREYAEKHIQVIRTTRFLRVQQDSDRTKAETETHWGFIAQDVHRSLVELGVTDQSLVEWSLDASKPSDVNNDTYSMRYSELIPPMVSAIQRLVHIVENLQNQLDIGGN